jgi:hypothetical protein
VPTWAVDNFYISIFINENVNIKNQGTIKICRLEIELKFRLGQMYELPPQMTPLKYPPKKWLEHR